LQNPQCARGGHWRFRVVEYLKNPLLLIVYDGVFGIWYVEGIKFDDCRRQNDSGVLGNEKQSIEGARRANLRTWNKLALALAPSLVNEVRTNEVVHE